MSGESSPPTAAVLLVKKKKEVIETQGGGDIQHVNLQVVNKQEKTGEKDSGADFTKDLKGSYHPFMY